MEIEPEKQIRCQSCKQFTKTYGTALVAIKSNMQPIYKQICLKCQKNQGVNYIVKVD